MNLDPLLVVIRNPVKQTLTHVLTQTVAAVTLLGQTLCIPQTLRYICNLPGDPDTSASCIGFFSIRPTPRSHLRGCGVRGGSANDVEHGVGEFSGNDSEAVATRDLVVGGCGRMQRD